MYRWERGGLEFIIKIILIIKVYKCPCLLCGILSPGKSFVKCLKAFPIFFYIFNNLTNWVLVKLTALGGADKFVP